MTQTPPPLTNIKKILMPAALVLTMGITACSVQPEPAPTVTVTETAPSPEPTESETPAPVEASEEPAAEKPADGEIKFESHGESPRGKIIKHVGDWAGLMDDPTGKTTVALRITEIVVNPKCTSGFSDKSKNGQLVQLQFEVNTYPELKDYGDFWMSAHDFTAYLADGTRINDSVGAGTVCLSDADSLPLTIGPGEKVTGGIVLDLPVDATVVSFTGADGSGGWEWPLVAGDGA